MAGFMFLVAAVVVGITAYKGSEWVLGQLKYFWNWLTGVVS